MSGNKCERPTMLATEFHRWIACSIFVLERLPDKGELFASITELGLTKADLLKKAPT